MDFENEEVMNDCQETITAESILIAKKWDPMLVCDYLDKEDGLNLTNFPPDFFEIVGLIAKDCDGNIDELYIHINRLFVGGYNKALKKSSRIMIRFSMSPKDDLVIASVQFANVRTGNMERLYEITKRIKSKYGYRRVLIESVNTDEGISWCVKHGLVQIQKNCYVEFDDIYQGDYRELTRFW
jgi:hypothetical protein